MDKYILRKVLREMEEKEKAFSPYEVRLFKLLDIENAYRKKGNELVSTVEDILRTTGGNTKEASYYARLYKANHLHNGDYKNLTKDELIDPRTLSPEKVSQKDARELAKSKIPFKSSNLSGYWSRDYNGVKYYVITSFDWYPVYLFKENRWYEIIERYSIRTSQQMNRVNPIVYDENIGKDVILVTRNEMKGLQNNLTYDDIIKAKVKSLVNSKSSFISNKPKTMSTWNPTDFKAKFKVDDITEDNGDITINVTVQDAGIKEGRKMIPSNGGYLKGEVEGINKEIVENAITSEVMSNIRQHIGTLRVKRNIPDNIDDAERVSFKFTHEFEK